MLYYGMMYVLILYVGCQAVRRCFGQSRKGRVRPMDKLNLVYLLMKLLSVMLGIVVKIRKKK